MATRRQRNVAMRNNSSYRPQYEAPKRQLHLLSYARPTLVILLFIGLLYAVLFSPLFRVTKLAVGGNSQLSTQTITGELNTILDSSALGRNSLFMSTSRLEKQLGARLNTLSRVTVSRTLFGGLNVRVEEHRPAIRWKSSSSVFVLSTDGRAYAEATASDKNLPIVEDSTNLPVEIGSKVVPASFVAFTTSLKQQFAGLKLGIISISVPATTNELYVKTDKGYETKLDTTRSIEDQLIDLKAVLAKKVTPKEYVDLRIAGRVFYK